MSLPNVGMSFTPFDILPASDLNDFVENIEALAAGTGLNDDVITGAKINFAATGADAGIWWEEMARASLGVAGDTLTTSAFGARKYLKILVRWYNSGAVSGALRFNGDAGNNYTFRFNSDFVTGSQTSGVSSIGSFSGNNGYAVIEVINDASHYKIGTISSVNSNNTVAATGFVDFWFSWHNTSSQITTASFINTAGGDLAIGTELIVLGHN